VVWAIPCSIGNLTDAPGLGPLFISTLYYLLYVFE
jgi:hypothetical protein